MLSQRSAPGFGAGSPRLAFWGGDDGAASDQIIAKVREAVVRRYRNSLHGQLGAYFHVPQGATMPVNIFEAAFEQINLLFIEPDLMVGRSAGVPGLIPLLVAERLNGFCGRAGDER